MAYYTSSALDTLDMLNQIVTFLTSNGYTLIHSKDTDNLSGNGVDCREVCLQNDAHGWYITLLTTNTHLEHPLYGNSQTTYYEIESSGLKQSVYNDKARSILGSTVDEEDPYLGAMLHNSYTASIPWYEQPGAKKVFVNEAGPSDATYDKNSYSAMAGNDSGIPTFWVFANENPHCVHIVSEYQLGFYSHMTFGVLEKSHTFTGGQYVVGSARPIIGDMCYDGYLGLGFPVGGQAIAHAWAKLHSAAMYCVGDGDDYYVGDDAAAMLGWGRCVNVTGISIPIYTFDQYVDATLHYQMAGSNRRDYVLSHDGYNWCVPLANGYGPNYTVSQSADVGQRMEGGHSQLASTYDQQTGQAAPIPLTGWCEHKGFGSVYLGSYVHVAVIQMSVYSGKEEFTLGGETYKVFPMSALLPDSNEHGPAEGYGTYDRVRKEANCFQLGLAIHKVV